MEHTGKSMVVGNRLVSLFEIILRAVIFICSVIALALIAKTATEFESSIVNYGIFTAVFSLLFGSIFMFLTYIIRANSLQHPIIKLLLDVLNLIFTFIAGVFIADYYRFSCSGYLYQNRVAFKWDSSGCKTAKASSAFFLFLAVLYLLTSIGSVHSVAKNGMFYNEGRTNLNENESYRDRDADKSMTPGSGNDTINIVPAPRPNSYEV